MTEVQSNMVRVYIVDAFTRSALAGNPAGVVILKGDEWPDSETMRGIADELGHETAFARRLDDSADADWALRWFTPGAESNVCGHATLATLHVLREEAGEALALRFSSGFGDLLARADATGPVTLDFPAAPLSKAAVPDGLSEALGVDLREAIATGALGDLIVLAPDEASVRGMVPSIAGVGRVIDEHELRGVIVTAPADDPSSDHDFVSRFFMPSTGIPEDSVTGSAHTALAPYWAEKLGRDTLVGFQASARTGTVSTTIVRDRVELTGHAVTVLDGFLNLELASTEPAHLL